MRSKKKADVMERLGSITSAYSLTSLPAQAGLLFS